MAGVVGAAAVGVTGASGVSKGGTSGLGRDEFLRLLTTQMRYQNPLDPLKDADFIAQLAQFSSLEGIQNLNSSFADMVLMQGLTQGAGLIGRTVVFDREGNTVRGTVDSLQVSGGKVHLVVGGETVVLQQVRGIEAASR